MNNNPIVITTAMRTPIGGFLGALKNVTAPQLGAHAIAAALKQSHVAQDKIDKVLMGCVLSAGLGQAPARQAALLAGLPHAVDCTTINKMCGSGMKAIMLACDQLCADPDAIIIAGGLESMSNAPYLLPKARAGYRMGHQQAFDHMFLDGLEDAYDKGRLMGCFAETCAQHFHFSREMQDEFAVTSLKRAQHAIAHGSFQAEIAPITINTPHGEQIISVDEQPGAAKIDKIPLLKPAFAKDGTVTAANSSSISDGAAALLLMRLETAKKHGLEPLAKVVAHSAHAQEPAWFTTAPVYAIEKLLAKTNWPLATIDLFEINEAFAVVTLAAMQQLNLPAEKVNVHGGACALGHPIGASGARIIVTLLHALQKHSFKRGIAAVCIGGGEATALAVEMY